MRACALLGPGATHVVKRRKGKCGGATKQGAVMTRHWPAGGGWGVG
jgi:hypothetical protein